MLALLNIMLMTFLVANVNTGDNRKIVLWVILAVVALALVIVMSVLSKKRKGNKDDNGEN